MSIPWRTAGVVLLAAATAAAACAQQGGAQRGIQPETTDEPAVKNGHQYVVAIGIDHYENWPILSTAVSDATGFAKLLTSKFGFEYAVEPLTEKNATREAIFSLIDDDLRNRLKPEDSLVIFFAGHGTTRNDKIGDQTRSVGFIVPADARAPGANEHWSDYLNVEELLHTIDSLPASHILVILDSCHSGMALGSKFSTSRDDTRFQRDMLVKVSRKVIASAQGDQLAADSGPLPNHSLFTGLMIQGLTNGKGGQLRGGICHVEPTGRLCAARGRGCGGIEADSAVWRVRRRPGRRAGDPHGRGSPAGCGGRREPGDHADEVRGAGAGPAEERWEPLLAERRSAEEFSGGAKRGAQTVRQRRR